MDESAFPFSGLKTRRLDNNIIINSPETSWGLSKRELFAAMAMHGLLIRNDPSFSSLDASYAVDCAIALIKELDERENG